MKEDIFKQFGVIFSPPTVTHTFTHKQHILCIAIRFSRLLRRDLSPDQMTSINNINRDEMNDGFCATHAYCDPNMLMLEAYSLETDIPQKEVQMHLTSVMDVLNEAWTIARECEFDTLTIHDLNKQTT